MANTSRTLITPACSGRSKRCSVIRTIPGLLFAPDATTTVSDLVGHPTPWHFTLTVAPTGACTVSRLIFAPTELYEPAIRTIGNGWISVAAGAVTGIVSATTL